ncbi:hypothetical protein OSTOST_16805, partial [Ostertagia ostertagi]
MELKATESVESVYLKMVSCGVCGEIMADGGGKWPSRMGNQDIILLMSLSLAGQMDSESAHASAESARNRVLKLCHVHIVRAAQYLLAEMVIAGKRVSHFDECSTSGSSAYVMHEDIPRHLVTLLNRKAEGSATVTSHDVSRFLNDVFNRHTWREAPMSESDGESGDLEPDEIPECSLLRNSCRGAGYGPMKTKPCGICGKMLAVMGEKCSSKAKKQNSILLMSLSLAGQMSRGRARTLAERVTKEKPRLCHVHLVQA